MQLKMWCEASCHVNTTEHALRNIGARKSKQGNICKGQDVGRVAWGSSTLNDTNTHTVQLKGHTPTFSSLESKCVFKSWKKHTIWFFTKRFAGWALNLCDPSQTLLDFYIWKYINRGTYQPGNKLSPPSLFFSTTIFLEILTTSVLKKKKNPPLNSYNEQILLFYRWTQLGAQRIW